MYVFFVILSLSTSFIAKTSATSPSCDLNEKPIYKEEKPSSYASAIAKAFSSSSSSSSAHASASASSSSIKPKEPKNKTCIYDECTPTCSIPNPPNCPQTSTASTNRCNCDSGYILSEKGGQCVKLEDCQKYRNCKGDRNASYTECPNPCASTCSKPNATPCEKKCEPYGCQCDPLYVLSNEGQCISPDDCPGGNPCGQNKTFIYCNVNCPTSYCPVNDNRAMIACDPPYPCPSGCSCLPNYKYLSEKNEKCILASECPPVECTRENEVWNSCPPACLKERCSDLNKPEEECILSYALCEPQCVCKDGYRRNDMDICVPVAECPGEACVFDDCTPTCSTPNAPDCPQTAASSIKRCTCDPGYILSEKGGKCVKLKNCDKYTNCKGNSTYTKCPNPCASTCSKPNAGSCGQDCEPYGCQCDPLYLLSNDGQCVKPDDCPGGNPCGVNKTFVYCNAKCPTNYCPVNDNRGIIACSPPYPCPSGCACKPNYKYLSTNNETCVLASECPPVECTRQNEVWNSCPPVCLKERCSDLNKPEEECNQYYLACQPQCICKDGYRRNDMDICVPVAECPTGQ